VRRLLLLALALSALAGALATAAASAHAAAVVVAPRTTLPTIERQVMCVTCKIPLNVAQSQQADRERAYIQGLINEGQDEAEVKRSLVGQYGPTVLGLPSTNGFDLTAYLVPVIVVVALLIMLALLLPRWRRHARAAAAAPAIGATLSSSDSERLDSDLARFN
jgi:cytochrome c-type biogenesis protein CcmH